MFFHVGTTPLCLSMVKNVKVLKATLEDIYPKHYSAITILSMMLSLLKQNKIKQQEQKCLVLPDWA